MTPSTPGSKPHPGQPDPAPMAAHRRARVLFLCTANSCRSQMAEGFARAMHAPAIEPFSAGIRSSTLNPLAVRAMAEAGVDIAGRPSKTLADLARDGFDRFDLIVAVCDGAAEACPVVPGARMLRAPFDDPPRLAAGAPSDDEAMPHYRRVRDEIRAFIKFLPEHPALKEVSMASVSSKSSPCCTPGSGCCGPSDPAQTAGAEAGGSRAADPASAAEQDAVRQAVREGYGAIARAGSWGASQQQTAAFMAAGRTGGTAVPAEASPTPSSCCGPTPSGGCCGPSTLTPDQVASAIGYADADLAANPEAANMGLSCGNPTAIAALKPGEVVLDLGSGGGFDCFIAGRKVGASGRVIGVDMTPDMLTKARKNIGVYRDKSGLNNVEFRLGEIENLPVADASVDVVISNCVLNLSPDKGRVWKEIARVLKAGGRVAVSDLALLQPLPESVRSDIEALVGCVAGAVLVEQTRAQMQAAGLTDIVLTSKREYIDAMTQWEDPLYRRIIAQLPPGSRTSDYITSLDIAARKQ